MPKAKGVLTVRVASCQGIARTTDNSFESSIAIQSDSAERLFTSRMASVKGVIHMSIAESEPYSSQSWRVLKADSLADANPSGR